MGKVLGSDGMAVSAAKVNMKQAELAHKVIMVYLNHQFGSQCQLCNCAGCQDIRERLGGELNVN